MINLYFFSPEALGPEDRALYRTAEEAYARQTANTAPATLTVPDLTTGGQTRREIPESLRVWMVKLLSVVFSEWAQSGPEPLSVRLARYNTLTDWAFNETWARPVMQVENDAHQIVPMPFALYLLTITTQPFLTALYGDWMNAIVGCGDLGLEAVRDITKSMTTLMSVGGALSPNDAWNGLDEATRCSAAEGLEMSFRRWTEDVVRTHLGAHWSGQKLTTDQGRAIVLRLEERISLIPSCDLLILKIRGVDTCLDITDETRLQMDQILTAELRRRKALESNPGFSPN